MWLCSLESMGGQLKHTARWFMRSSVNELHYEFGTYAWRHPSGEWGTAEIHGSLVWKERQIRIYFIHPCKQEYEEMMSVLQGGSRRYEEATWTLLMLLPCLWGRHGTMAVSLFLPYLADAGEKRAQGAPEAGHVSLVGFLSRNCER